MAHEKGPFVKVMYLCLDAYHFNVFVGKSFRMQEDLTNEKTR